MSIDDYPVGISRSWWYWFRVRLSDWIHPDTAITKNLPDDPVIRETATLLLLHGNELSSQDAKEILFNIRMRLNINPFNDLLS